MSDHITTVAASEADIREQAAQFTLAANPLVGVRGRDILASAGMLLGRLAANPAVAARQGVSLLGELARIATGGSALAPDAKDKRFADPAWQESAAYRALAQCYLAWGNALNRFVDEAPMDKRDAERARFVAPVKAGARVRLRASLASAEPQSAGRMLLKLHSTLEIEGEAKPALVAEVLCMLIGKRDMAA